MTRRITATLFCNEDWQAIAYSKNGWEVVDTPQRTSYPTIGAGLSPRNTLVAG
jgi:hypothetical protein